MADRELNIWIRAKDRASGVFGKFTNFLKQHFVITLGDVTRGLRSVISALTDMNRRVVEVEGVSVQFDHLAASIGEAADVMLSKLTAATRGTVSNFDLMKQANQAVLLGLNLNSDSMAKLAEGAVQLGKATGRTATEALADLITGLGRQSRLILDNLGLMVDATRANETYAASVGKTAEQLTEAERKAAFLAEGIRAVEERTSKLGDVAVSPFEQISASITNLRDQVSTIIVKNDDLNKSFAELAALFSDPGFAENVAKVAGGLAAAMGAAAEFIAVGLTGSFTDQATATRDAATALGLHRDALRENTPEAQALKEKIDAINAVLREHTTEIESSSLQGGFLNDLFNAFAQRLILLGGKIVLTDEELHKLSQTFYDLSHRTETSSQSLVGVGIALDPIAEASRQALDAGLAQSATRGAEAAQRLLESMRELTTAEVQDREIKTNLAVATRDLAAANAVLEGSEKTLAERLTEAAAAFNLQLESLKEIEKQKAIEVLAQQYRDLEEGYRKNLVTSQELAVAYADLDRALRFGILPATAGVVQEIGNMDQATGDLATQGVDNVNKLNDSFGQLRNTVSGVTAEVRGLGQIALSEFGAISQQLINMGAVGRTVFSGGQYYRITGPGQVIPIGSRFSSGVGGRQSRYFDNLTTVF